MTRQEVATMVASIGLPYAYYQFSEDTAQPCPFICFYYTGSDDMSADNINYAKVERLVIELYTDEKDFTNEDAVAAALNSYGLFFTKSEVYIATERMYETIFESEVILNG